MRFITGFMLFEAGALCGFFIVALMNAARAGQEISIEFKEEANETGKEHAVGAGDCAGAVPEAGENQ